jgi:hypothetical protein
VILNLTRKSGFTAPPAAEARSIIAFHKPAAFLKAKFFKISHINVTEFFSV